MFLRTFFDQSTKYFFANWSVTFFELLRFVKFRKKVLNQFSIFRFVGLDKKVSKYFSSKQVPTNANHKIKTGV